MRTSPEASRQFPLVPGKVALYLDAVPKHVVASKRSFTVELVIVNGLGRSFSLPNACDGWLLVNLASGPNVFEPGNGLVGCAPQIVPAGTTRVSREVGMTYDGCDQDPGATPSATMPLCGGPNHDEMPLLPPGRYRLQPDIAGVPHPIVPDPVTVILDKV